MAEIAEKFDQNFVSIDGTPPLPATNPYFINGEVISTPITVNTNPFVSAQPETLDSARITGDTNAQQDWLTRPSGDLMNLLNVEKRARRSSLGFR